MEIYENAEIVKINLKMNLRSKHTKSERLQQWNLNTHNNRKLNGQLEKISKNNVLKTKKATEQLNAKWLFCLGIFYQIW